MTEDLHSRLLRLDQLGFEAPDDYDYNRDDEEILQAALRIKPCLEAACGSPLTVYDQVQDASFSLSLDHWVAANDPSDAGASYYTAFSAVFSRFGRLVAFGRNADKEGRPLAESDARLPSSVYAQAAACVEAEGFIAIDAADLDLPYDGVHAGLRRLEYPWHRRFFGYL